MSRNNHATNPWTRKELLILEELYPQGGVEAVYQALGGTHTRGSIRTTAYNWGIKCEVPAWKLRHQNGRRITKDRRYTV